MNCIFVLLHSMMTVLNNNNYNFKFIFLAASLYKRYLWYKTSSRYMEKRSKFSECSNQQRVFGKVLVDREREKQQKDERNIQKIEFCA